MWLQATKQNETHPAPEHRCMECQNARGQKAAIVAMGLTRCGINIAALSETRFSKGQLTEKGYKFFWKEKANDEPRIHGIGFAVRNSIATELPELPVGITERLLTLRLKLADSCHATLISAYVPTLDATVETKEGFYTSLDSILESIPTNDQVFLLGNFNARVGKDVDLWDGVTGRHGVGNINDNGVLLLSKCAEHELLIMNTTFPMKDKFKTSWMHPRSKTLASD